MTSPEIVLPDNPLIDGDTEYSVRLVFRVNANNPEHARTRFIALLNEFGMNAWTYRVTDTDTEDEFLVRDGEALTPEQFAEQEAQEDAEAEAVTAFLVEEGFIDKDEDGAETVDTDDRL